MLKVQVFVAIEYHSTTSGFRPVEHLHDKISDITGIKTFDVKRHYVSLLV